MIIPEPENPKSPHRTALAMKGLVGTSSGYVPGELRGSDELKGQGRPVWESFEYRSSAK